LRNEQHNYFLPGKAALKIKINERSRKLYMSQHKEMCVFVTANFKLFVRGILSWKTLCVSGRIAKNISRDTYIYTGRVRFEDQTLNFVKRNQSLSFI
jgi:hypothetical protein